MLHFMYTFNGLFPLGNTCGLLKDACHSRETMELWDSIEWSGSDDKNNCHCKVRWHMAKRHFSVM